MRQVFNKIWANKNSIQQLPELNAALYGLQHNNRFCISYTELTFNENHQTFTFCNSSHILGIDP
ncbi:hypothetical protein LEP1GSC059_4626 [Leptospira noguchii serovar Panama str. CZ214]|uniref:Uncharacterized protein n=1 Tax=Leptospira noguchii serovar Panama str. CZ214 TaxID=1001595 RepID=T0GP41_9LEPT|nr:hypothetical protein LEP1GSC059_4626 [Leptospira noguchii serovar Panama str. CZ214]